MNEIRTQTRVPKYRAVATFLKTAIEDEKFENLLKLINDNKEDGVVMIKIGDRDVCSLKIEGRRIYIDQIIDETKNELDALIHYPVSDKIALRSLVQKYVESLREDIIEDTDFINQIREIDDVNEHDLKFILNLWGRFWEIKTRFIGDSMDGIYIIKERDVYDEKDRNTLNN